MLGRVMIFSPYKSLTAVALYPSKSSEKCSAEKSKNNIKKTVGSKSQKVIASAEINKYPLKNLIQATKLTSPNPFFANKTSSEPCGTPKNVMIKMRASKKDELKLSLEKNALSMAKNAISTNVMRCILRYWVMITPHNSFKNIRR